MASVYILFSQHTNKFYIGSCKELSYRIDQHVNKESAKSFTTKAEDGTLFFYSDNLEYQQARSIEQLIKKMKSKVYIFNLQKYPEIFDRLKATYE